MDIMKRFIASVVVAVALLTGAGMVTHVDMVGMAYADADGGD